jgi:hypothetical protein
VCVRERAYHAGRLPVRFELKHSYLNHYIFGLGQVYLEVELLNAKMNHKTFCFHVYDSGIGISKEKQGKLFECFVQGDDSSTRSYGQFICICVDLHALVSSVYLHLCSRYMHKVQGDESST